MAIIAAAVLIAWLFGGWGGQATVNWVAAVAIIGMAAFATGCAAAAARRSLGRHRRAWTCIAVGLAGWTLGECLWTYYGLLLHTDPFPSIADAAYLLYPVGACVGLLILGVRKRQSRVRLFLDGLIVAGALFEVSWVTGMRHVYANGGSSSFEMALALAYPVTDIVVVTVALLMLARSRRGNRLTLALLTAGNVLNAVADSVWVYLNANSEYANGGLVDIGYLVGLLLISVAALVSWREPVPDRIPRAPSQIEVWLPYVPIGVAAAVCTPFVATMPGMTPLTVASVLLISAVMVRQFLVVGENRRLLAVAAERAVRDPLTGLANRVLLHDRLTHALQVHERDGQSVAMMSLDLDYFKLVNDSFGHPAGDELLTQVAGRLVESVRTADTVARLGGDEFAVLVEGPPEMARLAAHRVARAFDEPFAIDDQQLTVRPSIGLAVVAASDPNVSAHALLKRADIAMYSAKRSRSGAVHTYTPDMDPIGLESEQEEGSRLLDQLRRAIDNMELSLVYQPKFSLRDGSITGVEALVRWPHPVLGVLVPKHFLPLVRRHGLVTSVTELVLAQALDDAARWCVCGHRVPIAVNIAAPSLLDLDLPNQIMVALAERGLSPDVLTIEITEDLLVDNVDRARTVLTRLRENGIRVAVDDFGAGYSALAYLRDLPVDEVKLDKSFVGPILEDARAAAIVRAVIGLAHVLGLTTVAEGVESEEVSAKLRAYGCDNVQGFLCSPPVSAAAVLDLLKNEPRCCATGCDAPDRDRVEIPLVQHPVS